MNAEPDSVVRSMPLTTMKALRSFAAPRSAEGMREHRATFGDYTDVPVNSLRERNSVPTERMTANQGTLRERLA